MQKERIEHFKTRGDRHLLQEGRAAATTVDLVLQARAADSIVSEMIKALPLEKVHVTAACFQQRFKGVG